MSAPNDDALREMIDVFTRDPKLAPLLTADSGVVLIMDAAAERVLYATAAAAGLRAAISDPDARVRPALRLAEQVRRANIVPGRPALARLGFDRRRIAPATTCILARTPSDAEGPPALLVALTGRVPRLRPLAADTPPPPPDEAPRPAPTASAPPAPAPSGTASRFTWRSDAADVLVAISDDGVGSRFLNRSWSDLSESRTLADSEGLLLAVSARRTFRAIPVTLRRPETRDAVELELSGTPLGRSGETFSGYGGFGVVRGVVALEAIEEPPEPEPEPDAPPPVPSGSERPEAAFPPDAATMTAPTSSAGDPGASSAPRTHVEPLDDAGRHDPVREPQPDTEATGSAAASPGNDEARLSSNEHAAFQEIARALAARFGGHAVADGQAPVPARSAAVMPFPPQPARTPDGAGSDGPVIALLEALPAGIVVYRADTALFANRRLLALAGIGTVAEAGGVARLFGGLAPHERQEASALLATPGGGIGVAVERSTIDWQGAPAECVIVRERPTGDPAGPLAAAQVARDFAEARASDAAAILDALDDGILTLDDEGRILGLNRNAAALFGLDPREVVGSRFADLFAPEGAAPLIAALDAEALPPGRIEAVARGRDGPAAVGIVLRPLAGGSRSKAAVLRLGLPDGASEGRAAAERASAHKSDFLAKVSHEIRTPMSGMLGFAEMMLAEEFGPIGSERYRDYLRDIRASGLHVLSLVNDLLDLAKIEAGRLDLAFAEVPLNAIVESCVALLQPQAARERILLRTSFSDDLTVLVADERSVRQAALNIIANAINYTEAGGQVIVSTTMAERGEIALRVRDTGVGMTPQEVETALEPFRQITLAHPRRGGGTGLGLPLTKALVEANHGRFRIESAKDEGTLVEMIFPPGHALSA